jgi:hypothetical protein
METALLTEQRISDAKCIPNLLTLTILKGTAVSFVLSVAIRVAVTQSNQRAKKPLAGALAADHELNRDYGSRDHASGQFAHFCGWDKPAVPAYFTTSDQAIGVAHPARRGASGTSGCAAASPPR